MRKKKSRSLLTEVELEFMNELWGIGEGTVRDVLAQLPPERSLAYTSGATILRILEDKGFVKSRKDGKSLTYTPLLAKDAYQTRSLQNLS
ncbi:MAG: BlaI/MecI/CopY family transcriptional regulator, partial [Pseudomonadota bacterium]